MQSIKVNIREIKTNLSKLIKRVQQGTEVIITNRDRSVAKIVSLSESSLPLYERIVNLELQGVIEVMKKNRLKALPAPLPLSDEKAQKYLQEDRNS